MKGQRKAVQGSVRSSVKPHDLLVGQVGDCRLLGVRQLVRDPLGDVLAHATAPSDAGADTLLSRVMWMVRRKAVYTELHDPSTCIELPQPKRIK